jgi:hypothetical protein
LSQKGQTCPVNEFVLVTEKSGRTWITSSSLLNGYLREGTPARRYICLSKPEEETNMLDVGCILMAEKNRRASTSSKTILNRWLRENPRSAKVYISFEAGEGANMSGLRMNFGGREDQKNT